MNNLYLLGGYKGSIYFYNGYSVTPFKKIPDCIANSNYSGSLNNGAPAVDPQWQWGGLMQHRQRLFFQAIAINSQTSNPIMAGIFSLTVNSPLMITGLETSGSLTVEAQNSYGLVPSSAAESQGLLIDNPISGLNYDNYYSVWSNGGDLGSIDYNDTTLWSGGEPWIETDLIEIGTFLENKTFSNIEFKLDQPMKSGDSITVYARQSLSDTYIQVGTTAGSTLQLSDAYTPLNFQRWQWVQFAISLTCNPTATSSSFMRLKEILLR